MICPKYDSCCFFINVSNGLVALISSITDLLVRLAVHGIRSSLLQHRDLARNEEFSEIAVINIFFPVLKTKTQLSVGGGVLRERFRDKSRN